MPRGPTSDDDGGKRASRPTGKFWIVHAGTAAGAAIDLDPQQRRILVLSAMAGGSCSITGLPAREMLEIATAVQQLKRRGLVRGWIAFSRSLPGQPDVVFAEITEQGRRAAYAQFSHSA